MKVRNEVTGVVLTIGEAAARRLGPEWAPEKEPTKKATADKATAEKKSPTKKSE